MIYNNLQELLQKSSSSRSFFLAQPVDIQRKLHEYNSHIRSAAQLHRILYSVTDYEHMLSL